MGYLTTLYQLHMALRDGNNRRRTAATYIMETAGGVRRRATETMKNGTASIRTSDRESNNHTSYELL